MSSRPTLSHADRLIHSGTLEKIKALYTAIDSAYLKVAKHYRFDCHGCSDNCCGTLFFHHTLIEFLYLREGFATLDRAMGKEIIHLSKAYIREIESLPDLTRKRVMCPLNHGGLCVLYSYRPMICRLHGVPYELDVSVKRPDHGQGCHKFVSENSEPKDGYLKIDRAPFYKEMASLEINLRRQAGFNKRYRYTVADVFRDLSA
ncbi:MAG: hypothetical protein DRH17_11065 [Deltaproteobacteria bacterium]|nr:MAG: hypothetical protein DRH17_11065 [Deltaproteobacteria bacterium]